MYRAEELVLPFLTMIKYHTYSNAGYLKSTLSLSNKKAYVSA